MRKALVAFAGAALLLAPACVKRAPLPPPPPVVEPPLPARTFGEIRFLGGAAQLVTYKDIRLLVDPGAEAPNLPPIDYLLLTDAQPRHLGARGSLRRDLKALTTAPAAEALRAAGFSQVKPLSPGQRLLLRKANAFLFVTAIGGEPDGRAVNGYLLEFDNGRNVFIAGERWNPDALREFVYSLRDDGREIHVLILYSGVAGATENVLAQIAGLIQPQLTVVTPASPGAPGIDLAPFRRALVEQMYGGAVRVPSTGDAISW